MSCVRIYIVYRYLLCCFILKICLLFSRSSDFSFISYLVSHSLMWKAEIPLQRRPALNEFFFFLLMKVRRESHLSFCDNLSLSPVISFAPLILIVLYNCVMWTSWSLKYCPYPFIITWCLEPLLYSFSCSALHCCTIKARTA